MSMTGGKNPKPRACAVEAAGVEEKSKTLRCFFPHLLGKGASLEFDRCLFHSYTQRRRRLIRTEKEKKERKKEIWRLTRKHHIEGAVYDCL